MDNVSVVLKSVFDTNLLSPSPGFETCYDTTPPPGQTTGGVPNVPSYDFNAAGTTELSLDLFTSAITGWTGQNPYFDSTFRAPTIPATGGGVTGGSLGMGLASDGQITVQLIADDIIEIKKSDSTFNVIVSKDKDYFHILRSKLRWSGR